MSLNEALTRRAQVYAKRQGLTLGQQLGAGVHGIVYTTESQQETGPLSVHSALKAHHQELYYLRERDVYSRLQAHNVTNICDCEIPRLLGHDDELWIIEMTIVTRPFVLDFAGAFLDKPPDFAEETWADWRVEKQEQFGPRWGEVQKILGVLETYGVFMLDVNPGNVGFDD